MSEDWHGVELGALMVLVGTVMVIGGVVNVLWVSGAKVHLMVAGAGVPVWAIGLWLVGRYGRV